MNIIVFASRKGGSGKSTLAAHLAAHADKPSRALSAGRFGPAGLAHALAQIARHRRAAAGRRHRRRARDHRLGPAAGLRMGLHRHAAEHVGGGHRRHPCCHADHHSGAAYAVRPGRHQGDHGSGAPAAAALRRGDQRRAAAARQHRVALRTRGARGAYQPQRSGLGGPDHPAQQLFAGAGGRRGRQGIRCSLRSGERDRLRSGAQSTSPSRRSTAIILAWRCIGWRRRAGEPAASCRRYATGKVASCRPTPLQLRLDVPDS